MRALFSIPAPGAAAWRRTRGLVAAPALAAAQATTGTVAGRVTSTDGEPIAGATVAVTGSTAGAITRGDGTYRVALRPGTYELRARLIGYASARDSVVVVAGVGTTRNFRLARSASTLEAVAIVGSRAQPRTVVESPVPIDVLTGAEIRSTGRTETAQILQQLAPSVNFPRATISDGTDVERPATLRGLGADQVLVLINGKRRHTSSLINVNGSVGRGQAAVDLNAIPASMIDRIEVLRDGAAAQYGSDAIAGVINIILKSTGPGELSSTLGETSTTYGGQSVQGVVTPTRSAHDGGVAQVALDDGVARSENRFFHAGAEYRDRGYTNRTLGDPRPQSFGDVANGTFYTNATGPINHRQGDAATRDGVAFFNGGCDLQNGVELYAFGGFGRRAGQSAGFFRRGTDDRTVRSLWPNGFLPLISSTIYDLSTFAGARGSTVGGFRYDLSSGIGGNSFRFDVDNSNNASYGNASPRNFYAGTLVYRQWTNSLDLNREYKVGPRAIPLRVTGGAEFRVDTYQIKAGEPASYNSGGVTVLAANGTPTTRIASVGSQVFPGFRPETTFTNKATGASYVSGDASSHSRNNVAVYAGLESDLTKQWLVSTALRYERYSDFGGTTTGQVASRYTVTPGLVLRGAINTGFRAPSLQQSFYSATATNFIGGVPYDVKTAPVASQVAQLLGATPLTPEHSTNYSLGTALSPIRNLSLTVDAYRINIRDRIVLSENFTGAQVAALLAPLGASGARYFTNAIDTRTTGLDAVANYGVSLRSAGFLTLTSGYNHNRTHATQIKQTPTALGNQSETLFGRVDRAQIEEGQPRDNFLASATYDVRRFTVVARTQRFGAVTVRNPVGSDSLDQTFSPKWVSDASLGYRPVPRLTVTVGADNVFDVYPDQNNKLGNPRTGSVGVTGPSGFSGNSNFGIFPYNQFSPFGFNGRFVYGRVTIGL